MVTPDEAAAALSAASTTMRRSRRAALSKFAQTSLVFWGIAWIIGFGAEQFLPDWRSWLVWALVGIAAFALTRWHDSASAMSSGAISGWEAQFHRTWWVLFFGSAGLEAITVPAPVVVIGLLPGALWGIAFVIYAVLAEDRALGVLGASIVVLAVVLRILFVHQALLLFGLGAGGAMTTLGVVRTVRQW
ncbi:MAG: hypothetical protein ACR2GA_07535 [Chloroflexota bacterium]